VPRALITTQLLRELGRALSSQEKREQTPDAPGVTKEQELLATLLNANQKLVDVFMRYDEFEAEINSVLSSRYGGLDPDSHIKGVLNR